MSWLSCITNKDCVVSLPISPEDKSEYFLDGDIPVPHFKRGKRESVKAYVQRMERETKHVMFLSKNQVDRKPEMDASEQERPAHCKSDKKKEWVHFTLHFTLNPILI